MVKIHIKRGDESLFLYETVTDVPVDKLIKELVAIHNGRLKVERICQEMEYLSSHGILLPPNMHGLTDEQISELRLTDSWSDACLPSGGCRFNKDVLGRRNGNAPCEKMADVLKRTITDARAKISKKQVQADECATTATIQEAIDQLRGAVMIVYPMGLPPHDTIRLEFENSEDLSGSQASLDVLEEKLTQLWWAGKEIQSGKALKDYIGKNEKTKIVAKLQKKGQGAPGREPTFSEEQKKQMMLQAYRRQEELKKLEDDDASYLDSDWADNQALRRQFHGLNNIKWRPR